MVELTQIQKDLLKEVAELDALPVGAYNIRSDGKSIARSNSANIEIETKTDKSVKAYYLPEAFALRHNRENDDELAGFVKSFTELKLSTM